ncbi:hypothetical protein FE782_15145 [Paenibacillus antri]|uniref:Uncharacterized protein n=1 Tax=Paenibacillus antri TaxID=2582848 RepID=A0A5R9GE12_9BACL|nr:twin-arginine translocase TatA/TatE family subunit [Paenibacillus antri]TLS51444.1 hypothetical protein FE782_15145 [Paenibacillus antri]
MALHLLAEQQLLGELPELGRAFGRTLHEFKGATRDMIAENENENENEKR